MKRMMGGVVAALVLAGASSAATGMDVGIAAGQTLMLSGSAVQCTDTLGKYGPVLLCSRAGSTLRVWISNASVLVTSGSYPPDFQLLTRYDNWRR
ncbi:MAG TPA: hypothetical protein VG265_16565 [Gaiellaceae bacterium]|jgi:hypothetical protein|nr:hypothetical protein [Gaiellaceae bacterium]